ncbi:MAG: ornithine carbamoyltransferase [Planctomycetota bacterium]
MRHFISLFDVNRDELNCILSISTQLKALLQNGQRPPLLAGHVLAMLFEKPSLRTRVSFEAGMTQLQGAGLFLGQEVGWQQRESIADFTRVLAQYCDFVVCRAKLHASVEDLASFNVVPVINGLTDLCHPCQALADLLTMQEHVDGDGSSANLVGKQITFVGDGNNVSRSLALACAMTGVRFRLLGPPSYFMDENSIAKIKERYPDADLEQTVSADDALREADFVYSDVWTSMGQEAESAQRRRDFADFQLNSPLMQKAPGHCKILHCLPANRGEEITDEVIDSENSLIVQQAGNRMHGQKGLLIWLALQHEMISMSDLSDIGVLV